MPWQWSPEYNAALVVDGWEIYPVKAISNKPVFSFRQLLGAAPQLEEAKRVAERLTGSRYCPGSRRLQVAADADPELAIGTAKEFLESICKTILGERGAPPAKNDDLPALVRATIKSVAILPPEVGKQAQSEKTITVLLNNLGSIGHQLAELRNQHGTGHGRTTNHVSLPARHAKLAIGAAAALAVFLDECHESDRLTQIYTRVLNGNDMNRSLIALVIGNAAYTDAGVLKNPTNDADDIASRLGSRGFTVIKKTGMCLEGDGSSA